MRRTQDQPGIEVGVVRPRRFELLTYSFGGCRSIQLSYGRIFIINNLQPMVFRTYTWMHWPCPRLWGLRGWPWIQRYQIR